MVCPERDTVSYPLERKEEMNLLVKDFTLEQLVDAPPTFRSKCNRSPNDRIFGSCVYLKVLAASLML